MEAAPDPGEPPLPPPLATLDVADSKFEAYVAVVDSEDAAHALRGRIAAARPSAAHVPAAWVAPPTSGSGGGFDEDGEPSLTVGPYLSATIEDCLEEEDGGGESCGEDEDEDDGGLAAAAARTSGLAVVVVRHFGGRLLGVTCGRLPQCYAAAARLAIHRHLRPRAPLVREENTGRSLYGLAAGDAELVLNAVSDPQGELVGRIVSEVEFGGFRGAGDEELPRLQNLQADGVGEGVVPVYRYPGNYRGDEWETYGWSPSTLAIRDAVEEALLPMVEQKMNHCVANLYRKGSDHIAHHSDKDLDLDRQGVIVSVSLGEERVLELRRRAEPRDVCRITLPHGSMLVLGPRTNATFTHAILPRADSVGPRLSLTLRNVKTFLDVRTGRLFGQGVRAKCIEEVRRSDQKEKLLILAVVGALVAAAVACGTISISKGQTEKSLVIMFAELVAATYLLRLLLRAAVRRAEERDARAFFSNASVSGTKY